MNRHGSTIAELLLVLIVCLVAVTPVAGGAANQWEQWDRAADDYDNHYPTSGQGQKSGDALRSFFIALAIVIGVPVLVYYLFVKERP